MKRYERDMLPDAVAFYESEGLTLVGPGKWKTARCVFHGGSDSFRINTETGGYKCMACGQHGGDVLDFVMQWHGAEFMEAAEALGATVDDGQPSKPKRKGLLSPRECLKLLEFESMLTWTAAFNLANGHPLTSEDLSRLSIAARRIQGLIDEVRA